MIQEVVGAVRDAIVETVASDLLGLYVAGSLVAGGFDPSVSDIDFVAVLAADPTDALAVALERMHRRLDRQNPAWAGRIEVVYVSATALRLHDQGIPKMAVISPGEPFHVLSGGPDWILTWYPLREASVALFGPEIRDIIPPIAAGDFLKAVREHLRGMPAWITDETTRGASAYAILTTCRGLYTLRHGVRPSKADAAKWAAREFAEWAGVIESALGWRNEQWTNPGTDPASLVATRQFLKEAAVRLD